MFSKAIVRKPCMNLVNGITTANLGKPIFEIALAQHEMYIEALKECGLEVFILEEENIFSDSVFVEDTAVLSSDFAILCNPGDESRNKEILNIKPELLKHYSCIEKIVNPGTVDGGDVMMVGKHFYIGLSGRTNEEGAKQFIDILEKYDFSGSKVSLKEVLHLKTGVNYLDNNNLLVSGEFNSKPEFNLFNKIVIPIEEAYAANSLWINDNVLIPKGFPGTREIIEKMGYKIIEVDVSEFQKLDGGLSCLSLRF